MLIVTGISDRQFTRAKGVVLHSNGDQIIVTIIRDTVSDGLQHGDLSDSRSRAPASCK